MTATECPRSARARGSAPATSASPPVFAKPTTSDAANRIRAGRAPGIPSILLAGKRSALSTQVAEDGVVSQLVVRASRLRGAAGTAALRGTHHRPRRLVGSEDFTHPTKLIILLFFESGNRLGSRRQSELFADEQIIESPSRSPTLARKGSLPCLAVSYSLA